MHDWLASTAADFLTLVAGGTTAPPAGIDPNTVINALLGFAGVVVSAGLLYLSTRVRRSGGANTTVESRDEKLARDRIVDLEKDSRTLDLLRDAVRRRGGDPYDWTEDERKRQAEA